MTGTSSSPTQPEDPKRDLAQAGDISQDRSAASGGADLDCECDDCDCPICVPGCC
jgi:hypothetical protein